MPLSICAFIEQKMLAKTPICIICSFIMFSPSMHAGETDSKVAKPQRTVEQTLDKNRDAIMAIPDVVGAGISMCGGEYCIKVMVLKLPQN